MAKKWKVIDIDEADALYMLGIPLQYRESHKGKWVNDEFNFAEYPDRLPSNPSATPSGVESWRVGIDG